MSRPSRLLLTLLAATCATWLLTACNDEQKSPASSAVNATQTSTQTLKPGVAALVNGETILDSRVALLLEHLGNQNPEQANDPETRKMVLDQLITQTLIAQEAVKKGLDKKPEIADQLELTRQTTLSNAYVQDMVENQAIDDAALNAEYEKLQAQLAGKEYQARHILVDDEALANELIAKLQQNPQSFAALAKTHSRDPGSKEHGGELGWFDPRAMVPEFGAALSSMEKGQISQQPVKTQFGYHIIALDDARQKDIAPLEQIKPMLKQQMQQQAVRQRIDELRQAAKISIAEPAAAPEPAESAESADTTDSTDSAAAPAPAADAE